MKVATLDILQRLKVVLITYVVSLIIDLLPAPPSSTGPIVSYKVSRVDGATPLAAGGLHFGWLAPEAPQDARAGLC